MSIHNESSFEQSYKIGSRYESVLVPSLSHLSHVLYAVHGYIDSSTAAIPPNSFLKAAVYKRYMVCTVYNTPKKMIFATRSRDIPALSIRIDGPTTNYNVREVGTTIVAHIY